MYETEDFAATIYEKSPFYFVMCPATASLPHKVKAFHLMLLQKTLQANLLAACQHLTNLLVLIQPPLIERYIHTMASKNVRLFYFQQ